MEGKIEENILSMHGHFKIGINLGYMHINKMMCWIGQKKCIKIGYKWTTDCVHKKIC